MRDSAKVLVHFLVFYSAKFLNTGQPNGVIEKDMIDISTFWMISYCRYFSELDFFWTNCWLTARVVCRKVSIMSSAIVSNVSDDLWWVLHVFDLIDKLQCVSGIERKIWCPMCSRIDLMITNQKQVALNRRL